MRLCLIDVKALHGEEIFNAPLNLLALSSFLVDRKTLNNEDIKILSIRDNNAIDEVLHFFKPDMIGLSVVTAAYPVAVNLAKRLKTLYGCPIIIGGHHITGYPASVVSPFDCGVIGEGEVPLNEIVRVYKKKGSLAWKDLAKIDGVVYRDTKGELVVNKPGCGVDVELLPRNNWGLLRHDQVVRYLTVVGKNGQPETLRCAQLFTARGCPFKCSFCARQVMTGGAVGFKFFPVERVVEEIRYLIEKYRIEAVQVLDDTFTVSKERLKKLIEGLEEADLLSKVRFPYVFCSAQMVDDEFMLLFKKLGVTSCFIGIESGSERILKYLKKGILTIPQVKRSVKVMGKHGIKCVGSMMFFNYSETPEDIRESIKLIRWLRRQKAVMQVLAFISIPYPGTEMWRDAVKSGLIDKDKPRWSRFYHVHTEGDVYKKVVFREGMSKEEVERLWSKVVTEVNKIYDKLDEQSWLEATRTTNKKNRHLDFVTSCKHWCLKTLVRLSRCCQGRLLDQ